MSSSLERRTAVIVDQHPLWLESVEQVVRRVRVEVVGKATSATRGLELVERLQPDLLTTGVKMAGDEIDGITLVRHARERVPALKAIVVSMYDDTQHVEAALAAGAVAYVLKTAHPDDLTSAIRQAFQHSMYLAGVRAPQPASSPPVDDSPGLTRRELEVLQLVAEGYSNAQLAKMLWVTEQTVKFHLSNIYRKLGVANRTEASRWAQVRGLLQSPANGDSSVPATA
jgi:DNA-binding NarL/FixJ family response regulator